MAACSVGNHGNTYSIRWCPIIESIFPILGLFIILVTSMQLLISQSWRASVIGLAIQYLGVFLVILAVLPTSLAAIKIVAGWMAATILSASQGTGVLENQKSFDNAGQLFKIFSAGLVWILVYALAPGFQNLFPINLTVLWAGLILIMMGLLHFGTTKNPLRVILGLLTLFSGFEILYASLERSVLLLGLLALANLAVALVGAYLIVAASSEKAI